MANPTLIVNNNAPEPEEGYDQWSERIGGREITSRMPVDEKGERAGPTQQWYDQINKWLPRND